jgi:hypothetical protein
MGEAHGAELVASSAVGVLGELGPGLLLRLGIGPSWTPGLPPAWLGTVALNVTAG